MILTRGNIEVLIWISGFFDIDLMRKKTVMSILCTKEM